ncbi:unnamed protein product [Peronospora belbahrii]|uniref:DEK C-terminal domain-containing protein n=1 Tax=Peronospora belbahrii TaxID=622444 RepID=A0AAU9KZ29_9STRA|nr:unnamed protein product [Peronospora belbahrii]
MMEALSETPRASVESLVTVDSIANALRDILPSINADTATLKMVMEKLAVRFGMDFIDLKAKWRAQIKALLPDMMDLCAGGTMCGNDNEDTQVSTKEDDKAVDFRPSRKRSAKKRNGVGDPYRHQVVGDSATSESSADSSKSGDEEDDADDDIAPVKEERKATDSSQKKKRKSKGVVPPPKKSKITQQPDSAGIASLKELGRAAGVLNPQVYRLLKHTASAADAEKILRDRLHDADICFAGLYPSSREISAARRKRVKEKELEGIDTSLIISGGRSRRGALSRKSYEKERIDSEEDDVKEEDEEADDDDDNKKNVGAKSSAISDSDSSEASF